MPEEDPRLITWDELDALPPENHEWLVEGLFPAGGTSLVVAQPKVGKSTTVQNLAHAVAHGMLFLGRKTTQGVVIYMALEDKQSRIKENFRKMGVTSGGNLLFSIGRTPKDTFAWLQRKLAEHKPLLIIIDPIQRLLRLPDTNDYAQVSNATGPLIALARESGAHVACVHHAGKNDNYIGSNWLLELCGHNVAHAPQRTEPDANAAFRATLRR